MVLRFTRARELGQILRAISMVDSPETPPSEDVVRGWQIELLADALERLLVNDAPADAAETRAPIRAALSARSAAQHAAASEIRILADAADALGTSSADELQSLVTRARHAFAEASRDQRRKALLRRLCLSLTPVPEEPPMFKHPMPSDTFPGFFVGAPEGRHLLCAGRDRMARRILAEALRSEGLFVSEATETAEVLERVARTYLVGRWREPLDLVLTDARKDGLQALAPIASLREVDWATPIVVIAAAGETDVIEEAKRLGASAILESPFRMPDLIRLLASVL